MSLTVCLVCSVWQEPRLWTLEPGPNGWNQRTSWIQKNQWRKTQKQKVPQRFYRCLNISSWKRKDPLSGSTFNLNIGQTEEHGQMGVSVLKHSIWNGCGLHSKPMRWYLQNEWTKDTNGQVIAVSQRFFLNICYSIFVSLY